MKKLLILPLLLLIIWTAAVILLHQQAGRRGARSADTVAPADAIVVLGNAVNRNGVPNPCLRSRVEAAAELYRLRKAPVLVMSGGTDGDGSNEAEAMRDIAVSLGVPAEHIRLENRSESTLENLRFSTPLLADAPEVIIVSSAFHLARAEWLAARQWPNKTVQSYSGKSCREPAPQYLRKLVRESLAWIKALWQG